MKALGIITGILIVPLAIICLPLLLIAGFGLFMPLAAFSNTN